MSVRRLTVSELIRESKPDWEPVRKREVRASTSGFSGCVQVRVGAEPIEDEEGRLLGGVIHNMEGRPSFEEQVDRFERQCAGEPTESCWDEEEVLVDDLGTEHVVVGKIARTNR